MVMPESTGPGYSRYSTVSVPIYSRYGRCSQYSNSSAQHYSQSNTHQIERLLEENRKLKKEF